MKDGRGSADALQEPASGPRLTLALLEDLAELLIRHGHPPPVDEVLTDLVAGLNYALRPRQQRPWPFDSGC